MILVLFLPNYFALNSEVPSFVSHADITNGLLNMELDKQKNLLPKWLSQ